MMQRLCLKLVFVCFVYVPVLSQEWTWLKGQDVADMVSSMESPGSRSGSFTWRDTNGDVWMFGGNGFSDLSTQHAVLLNDLWKYEMRSNTWRLIHPGTVSMIGSLDATNPEAPQPRHLGAACGVTNLTFVIFGGLGKNDQVFGDTWVYYIEKRAWLSLQDNITSSNLLLNSTSDVQDTDYNYRSNALPPPRGDMLAWCMYDRMIIFSGQGEKHSLLSDIWTFSLRTLEWQELGNMSIDSNIVEDNISPKILPRVGAVTWVSRNKFMYMFGGSTSISSTTQHITSNYMSDLWRFNQTDLTWILLAGKTLPQQHGIYGKLFTTNKSNCPGSRQSGAGWVDSKHNLWLFGGDGMDRYPNGPHKQSKLLSDLWRFDIDTKIWMWMGGSAVGEADVRFSIKGEISRTALVGGRCRASVWTGRGNKFYLFGGMGHDKYKRDGYLNDLWLLNVNQIIRSPNGYTIQTLTIFLLLTFSLILLLAMITFCTRDGRSLSLFNRFDQNVKYSHLSTDDV